MYLEHADAIFRNKRMKSVKLVYKLVRQRYTSSAMLCSAHLAIAMTMPPSIQSMQSDRCV